MTGCVILITFLISGIEIESEGLSNSYSLEKTVTACVTEAIIHTFSSYWNTPQPKIYSSGSQPFFFLRPTAGNRAWQRWQPGSGGGSSQHMVWLIFSEQGCQHCPHDPHWVATRG